MNKNLIITITFLVITLFVGGYLLTSSKTTDTDSTAMVTESHNGDGATMVEETTMDKNIANAGKYVAYTPDYLTKYKGKTKVIYFFAAWCSTCKVANKDITENQNKIPTNVVIIKTDYDTEKELKKKYSVTYQHTFVIVDDQGNEITKWNGGGLDEILRRL